MDVLLFSLPSRSRKNCNNGSRSMSPTSVGLSHNKAICFYLHHGQSMGNNSRFSFVNFLEQFPENIIVVSALGSRSRRSLHLKAHSIVNFICVSYRVNSKKDKADNDWKECDVKETQERKGFRTCFQSDREQYSRSPCQTFSPVETRFSIAQAHSWFRWHRRVGEPATPEGTKMLLQRWKGNANICVVISAPKYCTLEMMLFS